MMIDSKIAEWYRGKAIFITGATGFLAKLVVEKLLRSCPGTGPIYVLIRKKKALEIQERLNNLMTSNCFDVVRNSVANFQDKVIPILGDVSQPDLGISVEDRRLLQDTVSVVFHVAATVKFDEPLRVAMAVNFEGTRSVMELCRRMTNLRAIVHVSTAYTNCHLSSIEECVYPPPMDPEKLVDIIASMDDDSLKLATPRLIGHHPNTYTFSKALAEHLVAQYSTELPVVIVRPSIITGIWREPVAGWVDNSNGPVAVVVGGAKGWRKGMYGNEELIVDLIPVDVCVNLSIAAAWEIGERGTEKLVPELRVYNCVSQPFKPITWKEFLTTMSRCMKKYPMNRLLSPPSVRMIASEIEFALTNIPEPTMLAVVLDNCVRLFGGKPRLQSILRKLSRLGDLIRFFGIHEYKFNVDNVTDLKLELNSTDRLIFNFDMTSMIWEDYLEEYYFGMRRYVVKEKDDTIDKCRQNLRRLILIRIVVQISALVLTATSFYKLYYSTTSFW